MPRTLGPDDVLRLSAPADLAAYAGVYRSDARLVTITIDGDRLVARVRYTPEGLARFRAVFAARQDAA